MSNKKLFGSIGILLILLAIFFIRFPVLVFEFSDRIVYAKTTQFDLGWIHSVEKEEWIEHYEIDQEQLLLESTKFKTFGAGVPSIAEDVELVDGYVKMKINQPYKELNLTISEHVDSTIYLDDKEIKIYDYGETYDTVLISVKKIFIWQYLGGEFL
ncbi:DUF1850 domain-containing protein [Psychrobacillus sp. MER TA 171]|nr:DUF1850 domain-containing protein [Psychrobacillus sp. MER TA 171]MCM3359446.1 DUF1850 domain-containing protein [Psychrobacillus sp. MER TA 171]